MCILPVNDWKLVMRQGSAFTFMQSEPPVVRKGFTLIELMVVIAVISLLASILMPSLNQAKYLARRTYCLSNIRSQYLAQMTYTTEHDGKFPHHRDPWTYYMRNSVSLDMSRVRVAYHDYITDSRIFACPLLAHFTQRPAYADPDYYNPIDLGLGGWGAYKPEIGQDPLWIYTAYSWFTNFTYYGAVTDFQFTSFEGIEVDEPPWPNVAEDCAGDAAMIAHHLVVTTQYGTYEDFSHDGAGPVVFSDFGLDNFESKDSPVGYGDGHVEVHDNTQIRPRAYTGGPTICIDYY